jgi:tRNA nucleotidyltransferase (CCA-adding enzyme)
MSATNTAALNDDLLLRGVWEGLGTPESHITGGYVRDRILGRPSIDLDVVLPGDLDAARGPARRLAARLDTRAHILGQESKRVWRIETPEIKIELWPLGGLSIADDIRRRDFSCNALVWRLPNGPLLDQVGGVGDLENRVIRALSKRNLEDDPVRLVRAPRFAAQLDGFTLEPQTAGWIQSLAPRLADAPRERVGHELVKLLGASRVDTGLAALVGLGLLGPSSPDPTSCDRRWLESNPAAASRLAGSQPHPVPAAVAAAGGAGRLALLLRGWGNPDEDAVTHYAWPKADRHHAARAAAVLDQSLRSVGAPAPDRRSFIHAVGTTFPAALAFAAAVEPHRPWRRWWRLWEERGAELVEPAALLSGEEIVALLNIAPGPALGRAVDALTEAQVRGEVRTASGATGWLRRWSKRNLKR